VRYYVAKTTQREQERLKDMVKKFGFTPEPAGAAAREQLQPAL
jgi:hypothetical protein